MSFSGRIIWAEGIFNRRMVGDINISWMFVSTSRPLSCCHVYSAIGPRSKIGDSGIRAIAPGQLLTVQMTWQCRVTLVSCSFIYVTRTFREKKNRKWIATKWASEYVYYTTVVLFPQKKTTVVVYFMNSEEIILLNYQVYLLQVLTSILIHKNL